MFVVLAQWYLYTARNSYRWMQVYFCECFCIYKPVVVQVEQLVQCLCVWTITFVLNDLWPKYLACWFILTLSRSASKVNVRGQSSWSHDEGCSFFSCGLMLLWMYIIICCIYQFLNASGWCGLDWELSKSRAVIRNSLLVLGLVLCVFGRGELAVPLIASAVI